MKMRNTLIVCLTTIVVGCGSDEARTISRLQTVCTDSTIEQRADFTLRCIDFANPKSDEEPEDWIRICKEIAEDTYCHKKKVTIEQFKPAGGLWHDVSVSVSN